MNIIFEKTSSSTAETETIAKEFTNTLKPGAVIAMYGDMGAGKTAFVRGAAKALGINEGISSPTFSLVHEYDGAIPLYHFDMYRICGYESLFSTGFFEYLGNGGIYFIEWAENIEEFLPKDNLYKLTIKKINTDDIFETEGKRKIIIEN